MTTGWVAGDTLLIVVVKRVYLPFGEAGILAQGQALSQVIDFYGGTPMTELTLNENERVCKGCGQSAKQVAQAPRLTKAAFGGLLKALVRCGVCGRVSNVVRSVTEIDINVGRYSPPPSYPKPGPFHQGAGRNSTAS